MCQNKKRRLSKYILVKYYLLTKLKVKKKRYDVFKQPANNKICRSVLSSLLMALNTMCLSLKRLVFGSSCIDTIFTIV